MMSNALIIARRTMIQLVRDRRTIALVLVVPLVIASLIGVSIPAKINLDSLLPAILAALVFFFGFLLSGISFLRERSQGTMERLLASPASRLDIVAGYLLGFLLFAILQTLILFFYSVYVIGVGFKGDLWQILVFQMLIGVLAVSLGIFLSVFARNEFQMVQFIPLVIVPQMFLCGLLWPVSQMPDWLQWIANFLPMTYAVDGIRAMMLQGQNLLDIGKEVGIVCGYAIGLLILASLTIRRSS